MPTLHIHLDESGDWSFNPKGSKYFILTAAWTFTPTPLADDLVSLRYSLVREGSNIEAFHASEERQKVRDQVVQTLLGHRDWAFASIVMEKRKVNPILRDPKRFYPQFAGSLLKYILRGPSGQSCDRALVYADTIPIDTRAKREGVLKAIKGVCATESGRRCDYHAFSHCHQSNKWIQVADYCCWAMRRKWELGDLRTYNQLRPKLSQPELEITARGTTIYY